MSSLDRILEDFEQQDGVRSVFLLGRDGLLIHARGGDGADREAIAAMVPEVLGSASGFGESAGLGEASTVVAQLAEGVAVLVAVSGDLALAVMVDPDVPFAGLLGTIRQRREELAEAV